MGLKEVFEEAAQKAKGLPTASNEDMLELYKNFKQSNLGDCNTDRPGGILNMKEKAKWDAWSSIKGTSKEEAMRTYINKVDALCGTSLASKV